MTGDVRQQLTEALDEAEAEARAATEGPWWIEESADAWKLHGVAFRIPASEHIPEQIVGKQILKAPKRGTTYAEYWPDAADAAHIVLWDPARELRLIGGYREMLDEHREDRPGWRCACSPALAPCRELQRAAAFWLGTPEAAR